MKQITTISYSVKEVYKYITEAFYDIYILDGCEEYELGYNLFDSLKSPEVFVERCKDGFSPCMLPEFHVIENLVRDNSEFIVIIYNHKDEIWATVNGRDINF